MAMLIFLLAVLGLGALMFAGHRLNMYLYTQGAMETSSHMQPVFQDASPVEPVREVMEFQDYGLRYARTGLLLLAGFMITMAVALVAVLLGALH